MDNPNSSIRNYSVAILAGGQGKRISSIFPNLPKPMINIASNPVLFYQLRSFLEIGIRKIYILAGYKHEVISGFIKDNFNTDNVEVIVEEKPLGTAGCLSLLKDKLKTKNLIITSGDLVFNVDIKSLISFHENKMSTCTLTVHSNAHPRDADLIEYDSKTFSLKKLLLRPHNSDLIYKNCVNASICVIDSEYVHSIESNLELNFEKDLLKKLIELKNNLFVYPTFEYIYDMGTPERYSQVQYDFENDIIKLKSLNSKKNSILLNLEMLFELIENSDFDGKYFSEFIRKLNSTSYFVLGYLINSNDYKSKKIDTFLADTCGAKIDFTFIVESFNELIVELEKYNFEISDSIFISDKSFIIENIKNHLTFKELIYNIKTIGEPTKCF